MRYHTLWPTQKILGLTAIDWSVVISVHGNDRDVALLGVALSEISRFPKRFVQLPKNLAYITLRMDLKHRGNLSGLVRSRGLSLRFGHIEFDRDYFQLANLPLGIESVALKPHPRLKWDQSPCRWYVCLDTTEATVYHYLCGYSVPCVFYRTRLGGLTYFYAASRPIREYFLAAEPLQWRVAQGLPNAQQVPTDIFLSENAPIDIAFQLASLQTAPLAA